MPRRIYPFVTARGPLAALLLVALLCSIGGCRQRPAAAKGKTSFPGRDLVIAGKYREAIPVLKKQLDGQPADHDASRAGLFLGKAHLALGEFEAAAKVFERTANNFPESLEAHKCRYKLALIALLKDDREDARRRFEELAKTPDGPLVAEAQAFANSLAE